MGNVLFIIRAQCEFCAGKKKKKKHRAGVKCSHVQLGEDKGPRHAHTQIAGQSSLGVGETELTTTLISSSIHAAFVKRSLIHVVKEPRVGRE